MPSDYDATEFVDGDFQSHKSPQASVAASQRAPTREEVGSQVTEAQQKLAELRRAQEELERERTALEETRRRQTELQTGRQEMVQNLTRGVGLLEEAAFNARRDAEDMSKVLGGLREALAKIEAIHEDQWTAETLNVELTRALTVLENARMEWNAARLKFGILSAPGANNGNASAGTHDNGAAALATQSFGQLCRWGLALTWPVAVAVLISGAMLLVVLMRR
jgi:hypothetical protein